MGLKKNGKKNNNFIQRTLMGALSFFKESVFADEYAAKRGFLQSLDPRLKVISVLLFLLVVLWAKNIYFIAGMYLFCLGLTFCSKINLGFFLKRTWIFMPLFSLFIALPALFSIFTPGEPLFSFKVSGLKLIVTRQGFDGARLFILRVSTSVSFVVLLALTTRHSVLLKVMRVFRVPPVFVLTFGMCYRYLYLFMTIIENTYLAIKSRVGWRVRYKKGQEIVGGSIAHLWQRSYQLSGQVYQAMLSRGYRGEPQVWDEFKAGLADWVWLAAVAAFIILVFGLKWA